MMGGKRERYQESYDDDAPSEIDDVFSMFDCIWGISVFTGDLLFETEYLEVRMICLTCGNVLDCCTCSDDSRNRERLNEVGELKTHYEDQQLLRFGNRLLD